MTGFTGIADSYARHFTGCDTVYLVGQAAGDEKKVPGRWVNVMLLELVEQNPTGASPLPKETPPAG